MRERSRRRAGMGFASMRIPVIAAVALGVAFGFLSLTIVPANTVPANTAAEIMTNVRGYVWDSLYNPVVGADVTVRMLKPGGELRSELTDVTDSGGMYSVVFNNGMGSPWAAGDTIEVTASYDIYQNDNSTIAEDLPLQWVNVSLMEYTIPEFGSSLVIVISGTLAVFMAVAHSARRKR